MTAARAPQRLRSVAGAAAVALVCAAGALASVALLRGPAKPQPGAGAAAVIRRGPLMSMFQDDRLLLDSPTGTVTRTLNELRSLGVDRLRLTVLWSAIAPDPLSARRPRGFAAAVPGAYPAAAWAPYDRVMRLARARGIGVDFDLSAPGPLWAMARGAPRPAQANHFMPSARAFEQFVLAVGRRYGGRYVPPAGVGPLPRVAFWSVWNEPNQPGWLAPQSGPGGTLEAARLYRGYVDAADRALRASGHGADTILIGELAPEGDERRAEAAPVPPIPFLDAVYCVGAGSRPLRGAGATALGCPASGPARAFAAAHPGLFHATGFAHHPYSFFLAPAASMSDPNFVPLADLRRLEAGLDRIFATYGVNRRLPIYLTEYGYETDPPNPFRGVSPATQAADLDEAEYLAWLDPRVQALSQFLLRDSAPDRAFRPGSLRYWSTFQTGLEYRDGVAKPALAAYRLPVFVLTSRRSRRVTVWGMLRPAPPGTEQRARVQWRAAGGRTFRTLATAATRDPSGVLVVRLQPPGPGAIRVAWTGAGGRVVVSRTVAIGG